MAIKEQQLCPFSKAIIGKWLGCEHALLSDRCAGKMHCTQAKQLRPQCLGLVDELEKNARFVLSIKDPSQPLTHQQYMKIKCGGLCGMQRVLYPLQVNLPNIPQIMNGIRQQFGDFAHFPYGEIIRDIAAFRLRKKSRTQPGISE